MPDRSVKRSSRSGKWGYDVRVLDPATGKRTRRLRVYEFDRRADAEAAVAAIRLADRSAQYGLPSIEEVPLLIDLIHVRLPQIDDRHERTRARRVLEAWAAMLPPGIKVPQIYTPHIQIYVACRQKEGRAPGSIDRELNIISATLHTARSLFPSIANWLPPKIPRPKTPKTRRERLITDDEYRRILGYLERPRATEEAFSVYQARIRAGHLLRFALQTGMRPKEIFCLRWEDVEWENGRIKVRATKTAHRGNSTRYVPLTSYAAEILRARQAIGESMRYVFSISGSPRYTDYDQLREACHACGIAYGRSAENGFELYAARHTFTTKLLLAGATLREAGAVTGHSDRELVLYYSHVVPESSARIAAKIEEVEARRQGGEVSGPRNNI